MDHETLRQLDAKEADRIPWPEEGLLLPQAVVVHLLRTQGLLEAGRSIHDHDCDRDKEEHIHSSSETNRG